MIITCETGETIYVNSYTLVGVMLTDVNLHRALLDGLDMGCADFSKSDLRFSWAIGTNFENSNFQDANLAAITADDANFVNANMKNAKLRSGIFLRANFSGANFSGALIGCADFSNANFNNTNLTDCKGYLTANFVGATANRSTVWPQGFDPAKNGIIIC